MRNVIHYAGLGYVRYNSSVQHAVNEVSQARCCARHVTDKKVPSLTFCYRYWYGLSTIWQEANLSCAVIACFCIRVSKSRTSKCILVGPIGYISLRASAKTSNTKFSACFESVNRDRDGICPMVVFKQGSWCRCRPASSDMMDEHMPSIGIPNFVDFMQRRTKSFYFCFVTTVEKGPMPVASPPGTAL